RFRVLAPRVSLEAPLSRKHHASKVAKLVAMPGLFLKGKWLQRWVYALDRRLRRRQGVYEYTANRDCMFRYQSTTAERVLRLQDGVGIAPGDPILTLHFWNENLPPIGEEGVTVAWAKRFGRAIDISLRELAGFLRQRPDLGSVIAIRIEMGLGDTARNELTG